MGTAVRTPIGKTIEVVAKTGNWEAFGLGNRNYNLVDVLDWMPGWSNSLPLGKYSARINFINTGVGQVQGATIQVSGGEVVRQVSTWGHIYADFEVHTGGASISILVNGFNRGFAITGIITRGILEDGAF